jgi:flagella basal body P-ring formation protein FlgA
MVERPRAGWRVDDDIAAGGTLMEPTVSPPPVIMKGGLVRLTWRRGAVTVSVNGIALHDAAVGRRVNVRLRGRRGNAWGTVTGPGVARLHS